MKKNRYILLFLTFIIILTFIFSLILYRKHSSISKFNWKMMEGSVIRVYLDQHPYSEAIIKSLSEFEMITGIDVEYYISPENIFQDKIFHYLNDASKNIDVSMTANHYLWKSAENGWIENLDYYIQNEGITHPEYSIEDFHPKILNALRWNKSNHSEIENGNLWGIPLGFELSAITYNEKIFNSLDLQPPKDFNDLFNIINVIRSNTDIAPLGVRGIERWNSLLFGYLALFVNYGLSDFQNIDGKLIPQLNSRKSIEFHNKWIQVLKNGVSENWKQNNWYRLSAELGAGKTAMVFDSDLIGYSQNISSISKEKGNLKVVPIPSLKSANPAAGIWSWGLCINSNSNNKIASWLFIQYFSSKKFLTEATKNRDYLSPPRISVLESDYFAKKFSSEFQKHLITEIENSRTLLTPSPFAIEIMDTWIQVLHDIYDGKFSSTEIGLDHLNKKLEKILNQKSDNKKNEG